MRQIRQRNFEREFEMEVRSYYYRAPKKFQKKYLVNHLISIWTTFINLWRVSPKQWKQFIKLGISHEEICIPGDNNEFAGRTPGGHRVFCGQMFSSTMRDGADGVRAGYANSIIRHPARWWYVEYEQIPKWRIELATRMILHLCRLKTRYDKGGVYFGFLTPANLGNNVNKWYCSEVCRLIKWLLGIADTLSFKVSPQWSAWRAIKAGHELKPLIEMEG